MKKCAPVFISIITLSFLFCPALLAATLNVPSAQYPTIQSAIDAAVSGDTIDVGPGTYEEFLVLNKSGIVLHGANRASVIKEKSITVLGIGKPPIIFCKDISGEETVITGFTLFGGSNGIWCSGTVSSLRVENNTLQNTGYAVYLENNASCKVINNTIMDSGFIYGKGNNTIDIIGNETINTVGPLLSGINLYGATALIKENELRARWNGAINLYAHSTADILKNIIRNNGGWTATAGIGIYDSTANIYNNIIADNSVHSSPSVSVELDATNSVVSVFNNIFYNNTGYNDSARGVAIRASNTNLIAKNNIFYKNTRGQETIYFEGTGTQDFSYNDFYGNTTAADTTGVIPWPGTNLTEDPLFVDITDFYLKPGSPCINGGDLDPQFKDLDFTRNDMGIHGGPYGDIANGIIVRPGDSIQEAIESASARMAIYVQNGTYEGDITIEDKDSLLIRGENSFDTVIKGNVIFTDSNSSIENVSVLYGDGGFLTYSNDRYSGWKFANDSGVSAINSQIAVKNCIIMPNPDIFATNFGKGIQIWNLYGNNSIAPTIENNLILNAENAVYLFSQPFGGTIGGEISNNTLDSNTSGIALRAHGESPAIQNNIITRSQNAIDLSYESLLTERLAGISNNCFGAGLLANRYNVWCDELQAELLILPDSVGNIAEDPNYSDPLNLDYRAQNPNCVDKGK